MSEPRLHLVLSLDVDIGDEVLIGETPQGRRIDYPILGGHFAGEGIAGRVLHGGADYYLERLDGCGVLNAHYSLMTDEGVRIEVHNTGLLVLSEVGAQLAEMHWPIAQEHYRCHCAPRFRCEDLRYGWLTQSLFIGHVTYPSAHQVHIDCFRIN